MKFHKTTLQDVVLIEMTPFGDNRGWFGRSFCMKEFAENNLEVSYPQHNTGYSKKKGTVRGLHFQTAPFAQDKLVRVTRGSILDVAVDLESALGDDAQALAHDGEVVADDRDSADLAGQRP